MARAYNIFVVKQGVRNRAAFTVRYECARWLRKNWDEIDNLEVDRIPDGGLLGYVTWPAKEFMEKIA